MTSTTYASRSFAPEVRPVDERLFNRQRQIAGLPVDQLQAEARRALRYELDLPAGERRRRVIERLRAWLLLHPRDARRLANAFAEATEQLDAHEVESLRETEEDAVTDGLSYHEFQRLATFMPSLRTWQKWFPGAVAQAGPMPSSFAAGLALAAR